MDKAEFFLLIPAIIYGVAILDLIKIFQHKKNYWETIIWGVYLFMTIVFLWTELFQKLQVMTQDIKSFFLIIIQTLVIAQLVAVITPEEKSTDTETYFNDNRKLFFLLMALAVVMNFVVQFLVFDDQRPSWIRPLSFVLVLVCAFWNNRIARTAIWTILFLVGLVMIFQ